MSDTASASAVASPPPEKMSDGEKKWVTFAVIIGVVALLIGMLLGYMFFSSSGEVHNLKEKVSVLEGEKKKLEGELAVAVAKSTPKVEVTQGATLDQCTAVAVAAVEKACRPPAPKLVYAKPQRSYAVATARTSSATARAEVYAGPALPTSSGQADWLQGKKLDTCIFRIKGEEKARTTVENGAVNCPLWEQKQVAAFRQKPEDKIWSKVYPTPPAL